MVIAVADKRSLQSVITRWLMRVSPEFDSQAEAKLRRKSEQVVVHAQESRDRANATIDAYIREGHALARKRK